MNKKGFTLIELLAVIIVLTLLIIFVVPNILESLNNSKKEVLKRDIDSFAKAFRIALTEQFYQNSGSIYGVFTTIDGYNLTNGKISLKVDYTGKNVICENIVVTNDGEIFLFTCRVNDESVDYVYGENVTISILKDNITGEKKYFETLFDTINYVKEKNLENSEIIICGKHGIVLNSSTELGNINTKEIKIIGATKATKVTFTGNGWEKLETGNDEMKVVFKNLTIDSNTTTSSSSAWELLYTKLDGNYDFIDSNFVHPVGTIGAENDFNFTNCLFKSESNSKYGL